MTEHSNNTGPPAAPRRSGRGLGVLALLLALAGLGAAGYLYYQLIHRAPEDTTARQLAALAADVARLEAGLEAGIDRQAAQGQALQALQRQQEQASSEAEAALREAVASLSRQAPPTAEEWVRAEVQYLLRIANHRLLLERDVAGALGLLQTADDLLAQLDDFALHPVRARLAEEIAALQAVQGTDMEGLFLRLEAVKNEVPDLPLRAPAFASTTAFTSGATSASEQAPPASGDTSVWQTVVRHLGDFVRVRRIDAGTQRPLTPDESVHLQLNLRLMLERAQFAAVRAESLVFRQSLVTAGEWVRAHMDPEHESVRRLLAELEVLGQVELQQPLPDISGSLNVLRDVLRNPT